MASLSPEMALVLVSVFINVILGLYFLFGIRPRQLGTYIMGGTLMIFGISNLLYVFYYENDQEIFKMLGKCIECFTLPTLYLYVKSYLFKDYKLVGKELLHFSVTPILIILYIIDFLFFQDNSPLKTPLVLLTWGVIYTYLFLALRLVKKYKKEVANQVSNLAFHNANWLKFLCYAFLIYNIFPLFIGLFNLLTGISWEDYKPWQLIFIAMLPLIYNSLILWKVLQNAAIMQGVSEYDIKQKYASSKLQEQEKQTQLKQVQSLMEEEKPFLNPDLKITDLAQTIDTSPRVISQIINEKLSQNFYDFTNSYRINYAKQLLKSENSEQTISEILYASGFNSKSSFNTAFKKFTGKTPSQFKKQYK